MKDLLIIGAGGYGREVLQWIKDINRETDQWHILGFLDDNLKALDGIPCEYSIVGTIKDWQPTAEQVFVLAIARPDLKRKVTGIIEGRGGEFVSVIHPRAIIGEHTTIGRGVVIYPYAKLMPNSAIGDFSTMLDDAAVGHDARVGSYTTLCGSVGINGGVQVGDDVFVGSHAVVVPYLKIGDGAYVGIGSVVIMNVKAQTRVFGNPARKVDF